MNKGEIDAFTGALLDMTLNFQENPVLQGTEDIVDLLKGDNDFRSWVVKNVRSTVFPNFMSQMNSVLDPVYYFRALEEEGITDHFRVDVENAGDWQRRFEKEFNYFSTVDKDFAESYKKATADYNKLPEEKKKYRAPSFFLEKHLEKGANFPKLTLFGKPMAKPDPMGGVFAFRHTKGGEDKTETFLYDELERLGFSNLSFREHIKGDIELTRMQQYLITASKGELFKKLLEDAMTDRSWMETFIEGETYTEGWRTKQKPGSWKLRDSDDQTVFQTATIQALLNVVHRVEDYTITLDETVFNKEFKFGYGVHTTPGGGAVPVRKEEIKEATETFQKRYKD